ncbi:biotin--[acetyl-CoA-carboxylase] ligase [Falsiroseomonas sp. CW058]|uniref:biotin--[acetyl-CoA-carboxylase] ligase n=1 Tax=Falsiroseomonas sp. CW058 TaxID=3388664 RepID=UPI003D31E084
MPSVPPGWRLRVEPALPSTQDLVLRLAAAGEPEGLAVLAHRQTAGRGREARGWESPAGNLHLSVLLRPGGPMRAAAQWGLLAGVALAEALGTFLPDPAAIRLKWPNDLLLGQGKLAGMLTDIAPDATGRIDWVVIGFGANLRTAPEVEGRAVASLGPQAVSPEAAAAAVLRAVDLWRMAPFAAIREAWMRRGPDRGAPLTLRWGARSAAGAYAGLAEDGSLLLDDGSGPRPFATGETGGR